MLVDERGPSLLDRGIGSVERILHLKRFPALGTLPPAQLALVAEHTDERFFPRGARLLRYGEPVRTVYFLVDGRVQLAAGDTTLGRARAGHVVGAFGLLARDARGTDAVAETDVYTLALDAEPLLELFEDHFSMVRHVLAELSRNLIGLFGRFPMAASTFRRIDDLRQAAAAAPVGELDLVERILLLRRAGPFVKTSINTLAELARGMTEVRFAKGVTLWRKGEPSGGIHLIVSGLVACGIGGSAIMARPGEAPGMLEAIAGEPHWYDAVTQTEVVALHANAQGLMDGFEDNFEMAMDYLALLSAWTIDIISRTSGERPLHKSDNIPEEDTGPVSAPESP